MGKIKCIVLTVILMSMLCTSASAFKTKPQTIDELLAPYQAVIDKINAEQKIQLYLPDANKEKCYNIIKNMSPADFEAMIRNECNNISSNTSDKKQSSTDNYTKDSVKAKSGLVDKLPNATSKDFKFILINHY